MGVIRDPRYLDHRPGLLHPDQPERLAAVYRMLDKENPGPLIEIPARPCTLEQLERVHTPAYIAKILKTAEQPLTYLAPDTEASAKSYEAAFLAVGGCIRGAEALLLERCDAAFALVRPPGHHAMPDRASGFCIFNNLGATAAHLLEARGLKRLLLVDWDVHHGQGIQQMFYRDPRVFYFSTHSKALYPYGGAFEETGEAQGEGYTLNIPLPKGLGDSEMVWLYQEVLGRLLPGYRPQMILVAAGFDAHKDDPMSRLALTETCFSGLTHLLVSLRDTKAHPPILLSLEGGYPPRTLAACVKVVLEALAEQACFKSMETPPTKRIRELLEQAINHHQHYGIWTGAAPPHRGMP